MRARAAMRNVSHRLTRKRWRIRMGWPYGGADPDLH